MPAVAITSLVTSANAFAQLTATSVGEKRLVITLPLAHIMTTISNNTLETTLAVGQYVITADPSHLYFKSSSGASTVHVFIN